MTFFYYLVLFLNIMTHIIISLMSFKMLDQLSPKITNCLSSVLNHLINLHLINHLIHLNYPNHSNHLLIHHLNRHLNHLRMTIR